MTKTISFKVPACVFVFKKMIIDNFIKKTIKILFTINSLKKKKRKNYSCKNTIYNLSI